MSQSPKSRSESLSIESNTGSGAQQSETTMALTWINYGNLAAYLLNMVVTYISITGAFGETNTDMSKKYQTLVTPAGWAFSIWGPIFIWEGVFAVAQMLPAYRGMPVVSVIAPFWWSTCVCQVIWSLVFAKDWVTAALVFMLGDLASLMGVLYMADSVKVRSTAEYWLLRAPFSLHAGWIIAASAVNASVEADASKAPAQTLLSVAVISLAVVFGVTTFFAVGAPRPDPIICFVAAWALKAVSSELVDAEYLLDPTRYNYINLWSVDRTVIDGIGGAANVLSLGAFAMAVIAAGLRVYRAQAPEKQSEQGSAVPEHCLGA